MSPATARQRTAHAAGAPRRLAWFNCFSGIAGDMVLGSLIDAGAEPGQVTRLIERLPIGGWSLEFEPVLRNGLAATRAVVGTRGDGVARTFMHIVGLLEEARLPDRVRERSIAAFSALAEAEGRLHRRPVSQVHFHEVGGHDTVVDIVGSAAALEVLGVDAVAASAVTTGTGMVRTSHGMLPNPPPAVVELLSGIPTIGRDVNVELTTPTGAAILRAWGSEFGPLPMMTVEATGYGAGSRELEGAPNCIQVVLGTSSRRAGSFAGQPLTVLETNLDDATGETLAHALSSLLRAGALDAWVSAIVMKKGRPGHLLGVLCEPALAPSMTAVIASETGSLGVRAYGVERWGAERSSDEVAVEGVAVRVKVSPGRVKAEHADVSRVAALTGLPAIEVAARAEAAWRQGRRPTTDDDPVNPTRQGRRPTSDDDPVNPTPLGA